MPINREKTFRPNIPWLNIYDPMDPVSGKHLAFQNQQPECCPPARDFGYAASWWLLLAHLKYLTMRKPLANLATRTTRWVLTDDANEVIDHPMGRAIGKWFATGGAQETKRQVVAWLTWILAALALTLLGAIVLPAVWETAIAAGRAVWLTLVHVTTGQPSG